MLSIVFRKMLNNKWMVACLLLGSILAVAMVSSIPIYTDGALKGMLKKDLDKYYSDNKSYPGGYGIVTDFTYKFNGAQSIKAYSIFDKKITGDLMKEVKLPVKEKIKELVVGNMEISSVTKGEFKPSSGSINIGALTDFQKHVKIVNGSMLSTKNKDGVFEAIVTEEAMKEMDLRVGGVYELTPINKVGNDTVKVRVAGVFEVKDATDPYWYDNISQFNRSFMIDFSQFNDSLVKDYNIYLNGAEWYYVYDYNRVSIDNMGSIIAAYNDQTRWFSANGNVATINIPALQVFQNYSDRQKQLRITLLVLQIPILLMLAFYIFMVSQLIIGQEKNEIAVMKSRGAGTKQIFLVYLIEGLLLSAIAIIVGPVLGLYICRILGASNGFLEFVDRASLPVSLSAKSYLYSLAAIVIFIATMMIPAFLASRTTIVQHKQQISAVPKRPIWKKFFFDIILLGLACWGLYSYRNQQHNLDISKVKATDMSIDPLLFLISVLFVLGAGLLLIRVFPLLIRLIFSVGRKKWSPVFYASLTQVGRSGGQEQFLMLFLILTLSIGIFNANAARTINNNMEDKIRYDVGADMTIDPYWESNAPPTPDGPAADISAASVRITYKEPDFNKFSDLNGVELATKVFRTDSAMAQIGTQWDENVKVMAIVPDEFARVSYLRSDLLPYHMNAYLNLLANQQSAILVSKSFATKYNAKVGDKITFKWGDQLYMEGVINAFVDYWPGFNPKSDIEGIPDSDLIIANLSYVQALATLEPYEIWIKEKKEASIGQASNDINSDITKKGLKINSTRDATQQIIQKKKDPVLQSTNGALTMGFMLTMLISFIGFIIYWTLSIKKRVLQFGIFRAMGLSFGKLIGILACEQILLSGTAIFAGIIIGGITSDLFVPLLQIVYSSAQQVPPFIVVAKQIDFIRIYIIVGLMLAISFTILGRIISRMNINQAIKLGED